MSEVPGWAALLARYSIDEDSEAGRKLRLYRELLERWGSRINLTGSTEWPALAPLFEEALWAARLCPDVCLRHVDIGSGGGFPLVPMKVVNPLMDLTLIESRERRAYFLEHLGKELGLRDLTVECCRLGDHLRRRLGRPGWDRASWKAVRIARSDWVPLLGQAESGAEVWLFHGEKLPVEAVGEFLAGVRQTARHRVPSRTGSWLSIFSLPEAASPTA